MNRNLSQFACSLAGLAVLSTSALAQIEVLSSHVESVPTGFLPRPLALEAHPDGGIVTVSRLNGAMPQGDVLELRRFDSNGDPGSVLQLGIPVAGAFNQGRVEVKVLANGETVFAAWTPFNDAVDVVRIDSQGQPLWTSLVGPLIPSNDIEVLGVSETPGGAILIATLERESMPTTNESVVVRALDRTTGAQLWIHTSTTIADRTESTAAFRNGNTYIVHGVADGVRALCVDAQGVVVYDVSGVQVRPSISTKEFVDVAPTGELLLSHWEPAGQSGSHLVKLSAAGQILWRTVVTTEPNHSDGVATDDGGAVLMTATQGGSITRVDGSGQVQWTRTAPPSLDRFTRLVSGADGTILVEGSHVVGMPGAATVLAAYDMDGTAMGQSDSDPLTFLETEGVTGRDTRGDAWILGVDTAVQGLLRVRQFGIGDAGATVRCLPTTTNSTGARSRLSATGSDLLARNSISLVADQLPAGQFTMFLVSTAPGLVVGPGGSLGTLCLGGNIGRFVGPGQLREASTLGRASLEVSLDALPIGNGPVAASVGSTWHFQAWHRDLVLGLPSSNFTGAVAITLR